MAAALRHLLRPLKQIARAGTPRPVLSPAPAPALGLRPRTFSSGGSGTGTNKAQAAKTKTYTTTAQQLEAKLNPGFGMRYYRHGKMVRAELEHMPGVLDLDDATFRRVLLGIDVFFIAIPGSFVVYHVISSLRSSSQETTTSSASSPSIVFITE